MEGKLAGAGSLIAIESHGVRVDVRVDEPDLILGVQEILPPDSREARDLSADLELGLMRDPSDRTRFRVAFDNEPVSPPVDLDVALSFLAHRIREAVALTAKNRIFIHAGVVACNGRAIVLPGHSFAGKTTLVAALVRAGATYYSDEFAVLDTDGQVHPYAKPLSIRDRNGQSATEVPATELGGAIGHTRAPVAVVAITSYRPDAHWHPVPVLRGEIALALMSHAIPARERPAEALHVVRRAAEGCICVRSGRGEAEPGAHALLSLLEIGGVG